MAGALITINQAANPPGVPGAAREDLDLFGGANPVLFTNDDDIGVVSWAWTLVDRPNGSAAVLAGPATPAPTLNADVTGSYLVRLVTVDGSGNTYQDEIVAAVTLANGWRIPAAFETTQFHVTRGWAEELDEILRDIAAGGLLFIPLQSAYDDGPGIVTDASGQMGWSRGAATAVGQGVLVIADANLAPGRTVPLVDIDDDNIVGAGVPSTFRVSRVAAGLVAEFAGDVEVTGKLTVGGLIDPTGLVLDEQAAVPGGAPGAAKGTFWVKNDAPSAPYFTDDAGADHALAFVAAAVTLQAAYDAGEAVITDAQGALDLTRGALTPQGEAVLMITDNDASTARTQVLIDITDNNAVALSTVSTLRISRAQPGYAVEVSGDVGLTGASRISAQVGTAALPPFNFINFDTSGFFHDGAGAVGVSIAATEVARYESTGETFISAVDAAATSSVVALYHGRATPTDGDSCGILAFDANDDNVGLNRTRYAYVEGIAVDVSDTTEDGRLDIRTAIAGASTLVASLGVGSTFYTINRVTFTRTAAAPAAHAAAYYEDNNAAAGRTAGLLYVGDINDGTGASLYISRSTVGGPLANFECSNAGAVGAMVDLYHDSASPATDDAVGIISFYGEDSGGTKTLYGDIRCKIDTVTDPSEDGELSFRIVSGGAMDELLSISKDLFSIQTAGQPTLQVGVAAWGHYFHANFEGSSANRTTRALTSTLTTDEVLFTHTLDDTRMYTFYALVTGRKSDGAKFASYQTHCSAYRQGAGAVELGETADSSHESDATWDAHWAANGNAMELLVHGNSSGAETVYWVAEIFYQSVSTSGAGGGGFDI